MKDSQGETCSGYPEFGIIRVIPKHIPVKSLLDYLWSRKLGGVSK